MRRTRLAVAAAMLAAGTPMLWAGAAQAASQTVEDATFTWMISTQAWTSSSLSPSHATTGNATKVADVGFRFTEGEGTVDDATGEVDLEFSGSVTLGNVVQGAYRIVLADPEVSIDATGAGEISVALSYCAGGCDAPGATFVDAGRVVASTFDTSGPAAAGTTRTWDETPIAELVAGDNPDQLKQFPQTFVGALPPSMQGHFKQTAQSATAAKLPAPFTLTAELPAPEAPAIRPEGELDEPFLAWAVSEYAWNVPSLSGWASAGAPAVKGEAAYEFSSATGTYDAETGELAAGFDGTIYLGNNYGTVGYRVALGDPTILVDADGNGRVLADVTSCVFGQGGAPADACDDFESATGPQVEVTTFTVDEGDVVTDEDSVVWTVTPSWDPAQFSQPFLDVLPSSLKPFFQATGSTSDDQKKPAELSLSLGLPEDPGGEDPGGEDPGGEDPGENPGGEDPGTDPGELPDGGTIVGGHLEWGIKTSFRSYLVGPIAEGTVTAEAPATQAPDNGPFSFPVEGEGAFDSATALDADFAGSVHLYGHHGELDVTFANPEVTIEGTTGELRADIEANEHGTEAQYDEEDVLVATLDLSGVTPTRVGDTVTYADIPATLVEDGEIGFSGYYRAGDALDPVTLVLDVEGADLGGLPAPDPDKDKVTCTPTAPVAAGSPIEVCGTGFLPGEQVLVLMHSTPVQIGLVTADADGAVRATVTLPADAPAGEHRIELRGVTSGRSIFSDPFTVVAGSGVGSGRLPRTGGDPLPVALFGGLLVLVGAASMASRRRAVPVEVER